MAKKDVEDTLVNYLSDLLDEPSSCDSNQTGKEVETSLINQEKSEQSDSIQSVKVPPPKENAPDTQDQKPLIQLDVALKDTTASPLPDKSIASPPSTVDRSQASVIPTQTPSEPKPVSAYEQQKQRLEKMLSQLSPLTNTATSIATPGLDNSSLENTELGIDTEELLHIQDDYIPLPPLSSEWLENGRPNWAQEQFDILLIEVNGLQLALPLQALGHIHPLEADNLTALFGQSDWFMGLQQTPAGSVKTVNTTKFVMPERYQDAHDYKFVVSINGLGWGLAVDSIHQPISVDPEAIRWRKKRNNNMWMAGTVKDHMCVLLDIPAMGEILQAEDKNHSQSTGG